MDSNEVGSNAYVLSCKVNKTVSFVDLKLASKRKRENKKKNALPRLNLLDRYLDGQVLVAVRAVAVKSHHVTVRLLHVRLLALPQLAAAKDLAAGGVDGGEAGDEVALRAAEQLIHLVATGSQLL